MTYAILQISALAYADIRDRLVALDETLNPDPTYASEYILSPRLGGKERLVFGPVAFEALPAETATEVSDDLVRLFGMSLTGEGGPLGFNYKTKVEVHDWDWVNAAFKFAAGAAVSRRPPVEDMTESQRGAALEDDARTIHAEVQAAALRLGAFNPQPFESLPAVVQAAYITAARKLRAPWVAAANAAPSQPAASTAPPETA